MTWFSKRRRKAPDTSSQAVVDAQENLERIKARSAEVVEVSSALREFRESPHFANQVLAILRGP